MSHSTIEKAAGFADVDPRSLVLETNVRADAALTLDFVASIREHGVLVPILVQRTADGQLLVRAGQRRTLAAIEAGRDTIPARIVEGDGDEARRIIEQVVENDQRAALRDKDRVAGFQQLSLLGVPAAQIAKKTGHTKDAVTTALDVAKSKAAVAVQNRYDLTLDQAATIAEFDQAGDREAVKSLTATAVKEPGQFAHVAQRLRDERDLKARRDAAIAALADAGIRHIPAPAHDDRTVKVLGDLTDADGNVLTAESHRSCPGHAAYLRRAYGGDDAFTTVLVCDAWKANKHKTLRTTPSGQPMDAEAAAKAKAERAEVIENNSSWRSSEQVRRRWLADFAKRKTAPKNAAGFIAAALVTDCDALQKAAVEGYPLAAEWLGLPGGLGGRGRIAEVITKAAPARAQHLALVLVLSAIEARTGVQTWRRPGHEGRYLAGLEEWGYTLSPVEQIARGPKPEPTAARTAPAKVGNPKPAAGKRQPVKPTTPKGATKEKAATKA